MAVYVILEQIKLLQYCSFGEREREGKKGRREEGNKRREVERGEAKVGRLRGRGNSREKETRNVDNFVEILAFKPQQGPRERERERESRADKVLLYMKNLYIVLKHVQSPIVLLSSSFMLSNIL